MVQRQDCQESEGHDGKQGLEKTRAMWGVQIGKAPTTLNP